MLREARIYRFPTRESYPRQVLRAGESIGSTTVRPETVQEARRLLQEQGGVLISHTNENLAHAEFGVFEDGTPYILIQGDLVREVELRRQMALMDIWARRVEGELVPADPRTTRMQELRRTISRRVVGEMYIPLAVFQSETNAMLRELHERIQSLELRTSFVADPRIVQRLAAEHELYQDLGRPEPLIQIARRALLPIVITLRRLDQTSELVRDLIASAESQVRELSRDLLRRFFSESDIQSWRNEIRGLNRIQEHEIAPAMERYFEFYASSLVFMAESVRAIANNPDRRHRTGRVLIDDRSDMSIGDITALLDVVRSARTYDEIDLLNRLPWRGSDITSVTRRWREFLAARHNTLRLQTQTGEIRYRLPNQ